MVGAITTMAKIPDEWRNLPAVLSIQDVADLMQVHFNTVNNWIKEGKIKAFKQGRIVRIYRDEFFRFAGVSEED